jgi:hypothetical protein
VFCFQQMRTLRTLYQSFLYKSSYRHLCMKCAKCANASPWPLASRVKKRDNFSPSTARVKYVTSKLPSPSLASQLVSNALELYAVARRCSESDDLALCIEARAKTSQRRQNTQDYRGSLETYLLARSALCCVLSSAYKAQEFRDRENVQNSCRTELNLGE